MDARKQTDTCSAFLVHVHMRGIVHSAIFIPGLTNPLVHTISCLPWGVCPLHGVVVDGLILPHPLASPRSLPPLTALTHPVHQTAPSGIQPLLCGNIDKQGVIKAFLIGVNSVAQ